MFQYMYGNWLGLLLGLMLLLSGCTKDFSSSKEMQSYLNDPEHGLVQSVTENDLVVTVKVSPPSYQNVLEQRTLHKNIGVILELSSPKIKSQDFLISACSSLQEYRSIIENLNFNPENFLRLKLGDQTLVPTIATFEDSYESNPTKRLVTAFPLSLEMLDKNDTKTLEVIFMNPFEGHGEQQFTFDTENIEAFEKAAKNISRL